MLGTINPAFDEMKLEEAGTRGTPKSQATHYLLLYTLVRMYKPRVAVEIGTLVGCSSAYIAQALRDNFYEQGDTSYRGHLWTFDNNDEGTFPRFETWRRVGLSDWITFIFGDSRKRVPEVMSKVVKEVGVGIQFAFLDGGHDIWFVQPDADNVVRFADKRDCVFAFHDINRLQDCDKVFREMRNRPYFKDGYETMYFPAWNEIGVIKKALHPRPLYSNRPGGF